MVQKIVTNILMGFKIVCQVEDLEYFFKITLCTCVFYRTRQLDINFRLSNHNVPSGSRVNHYVEARRAEFRLVRHGVRHRVCHEVRHGVRHGVRNQKCPSIFVILCVYTDHIYIQL